MTPDLSRAVWRKSSYSGGNNGACVELANIGAIRDSKNPTGSTLRVDIANLVAALIAGTVEQPQSDPRSGSIV
jgi:hypothetical protein